MVANLYDDVSHQYPIYTFAILQRIGDKRYSDQTKLLSDILTFFCYILLAFAWIIWQKMSWN